MSSHTAAEEEEEGGRHETTQWEWGAFRALGGSRSVVKNTVQGCAASNGVTDESDPIELLNQIL